MEFTSEKSAMIRNSRVCFLVPCYGGAVFEQFFVSFIRSVIQMRNDKINFSLETIANESLVTRARNNLIAKGMTNNNATHFMFVDADIGFNTQDIYKLIAHDKDIVCGLYPKKDYPIEYVANRLHSDEQPDDSGLIRVRHAGTGFMLIKRNVIERMFQHFPNTKYINDIGLDPKYEPNMYALFDTGISPDKQYLSEDYLFCERWLSMGGEVWVDTTVQLSHSGYHTFGG